MYVSILSGLLYVIKKEALSFDYQWLSDQPLRHDVDITDLSFVSVQKTHILCVHVECPLIPANDYTMAVIVINSNDSFEVNNPIIKKMYKSIPAIVTKSCSKVVWDILCEDEPIVGIISTMDLTTPPQNTKYISGPTTALGT